jgi:uncharacterized membrane protein YgcG
MRIKLVLLLLIIFISVPLFGIDRVVDTANLLSDAERAGLKELLDTTSQTYDFDMVIVSVKETGNTEPMDFAKGFFDKNGYGLGKDRDGCLLLVVTERKVFWFGTSGKGVKILTPAASGKLEKDVFNALEKGDFYKAFVAYTMTWEEFLVLNAKGRSYNSLYKYNMVFVILAWLVSVGIGFLVVMIWKKGMNTVIPKKQAASYIVPGSLSFAVQKDQFLYSSITKIARADDSDSDDGDTDTNSSGRTQSGGKYEKPERRKR